MGNKSGKEGKEPNTKGKKQKSGKGTETGGNWGTKPMIFHVGQFFLDLKSQILDAVQRNADPLAHESKIAIPIRAAFYTSAGFATLRGGASLGLETRDGRGIRGACPPPPSPSSK